MKYYLLGKSGLRVSELALGAMSFGTEWGWGIEINEARRVEMGFPHAILANPTIKQTISGGVEVHRN